jgi:hypothetical protein
VTAFEDVQEAGEVGVAVGARALHRVAHTGLGSEVDDGVDLLAGKRFGSLGPV